MNQIKKIFSSILLVIILGTITTYAGEEENIIKCNGKAGFEMYKCAEKEICGNSEYGKEKKKVYTGTEKYSENLDFKKAKEQYNNIQNSIYNCGVLESQEKVLTELTEKLIKYSDKSGMLKTKILPKIKLKKDKIKQLQNKNKCSSIKGNGQNKNAIKKVLLDQSTLELCKYIYFLKYLNTKKENNIGNNFDEGQSRISSKKIGKNIESSQNEINNEINKTTKYFPMIFTAFIKFDNYLKIHIMLELLKEDYRVFRDKLYQTLHPINQVVYKIINAQSK